MSFANPSYLWALLGVLVPIAIHLWSKKEAKTIKIGSVQLLTESKSKQSSRIQLNELWLLLLRILIISILTLIMARPIWQSIVKNAKLTYLVEPELANNEGFMAQLDSISDGQEIRLFTKEFPIWDDDLEIKPYDEILDYWSLASETDALQTDSIVVFTKGYAKGIRGARPGTQHQIKWLVIDSAQVLEQPLIAYKNKQDIELFTSVSTSNKLEFLSNSITLGTQYTLSSDGDSLIISDKQITNKVPISVQKPIEIAVFYADSLVNDKSYLEAAFATLSQYLNLEIHVKSNVDVVVPDNKADVIVWLSDKPTPETSKKILVYKKDAESHSIIEEGKSANAYILTKRINAEIAIEQRLLEKLLDILDINAELKIAQGIADNRRLTETELQTNFTAHIGPKVLQGSFDFRPYLWVFLFVLLIFERLMAYLRKQ